MSLIDIVLDEKLCVFILQLEITFPPMFLPQPQDTFVRSHIFGIKAFTIHVVSLGKLNILCKNCF